MNSCRRSGAMSWRPPAPWNVMKPFACVTEMPLIAAMLRISAIRSVWPSGANVRAVTGRCGTFDRMMLTPAAWASELSTSDRSTPCQLKTGPCGGRPGTFCASPGAGHAAASVQANKASATTRFRMACLPLLVTSTRRFWHHQRVRTANDYSRSDRDLDVLQLEAHLASCAAAARRRRWRRVAHHHLEVALQLPHQLLHLRAVSHLTQPLHRFLQLPLPHGLFARRVRRGRRRAAATASASAGRHGGLHRQRHTAAHAVYGCAVRGDRLDAVTGPRYRIADTHYAISCIGLHDRHAPGGRHQRPDHAEGRWWWRWWRRLFDLHFFAGHAISARHALPLRPERVGFHRHHQITQGDRLRLLDRLFHRRCLGRSGRGFRWLLHRRRRCGVSGLTRDGDWRRERRGGSGLDRNGAKERVAEHECGNRKRGHRDQEPARNWNHGFISSVP